MARIGACLSSLIIVTVVMTACSADEGSGNDQPSEPDVVFALPVEEDEIDTTYNSPNFLLLDDVVLHGALNFVGASTVTISDASTGEQLWQLASDFKIIAVTSSSVVAVRDAEESTDSFDADDLFTVTVFDLKTGEQLFGNEYGSIAGQRVAVTEDTYVIIHSDPYDLQSQLTAVDLTTGDTSWTKEIDGAYEDLMVIAPVESTRVDSTITRQQQGLVRAGQSHVVYVSSEPDETQVIDTSDGTVLTTLPTPIKDGRTAQMGDSGWSIVQPQAFPPGQQNADACDFTFYTVSPKGEVNTIESHLSSLVDGAWPCGSMAGRLEVSETMVTGQTADHSPELISIATGQVIWTGTEPAMPIFNADGVLLTTPEPFRAEAIDTTTGDSLWTSDMMLGHRNTVIDNHLLTSWDYWQPDADNNSIRAINMTTGELVWEITEATLLAANDQLIYALQSNPDTQEHSLIAIDITTFQP